jgi:hypothetical protein
MYASAVCHTVHLYARNTSPWKSYTTHMGLIINKDYFHSDINHCLRLCSLWGTTAVFCDLDEADLHMAKHTDNKMQGADLWIIKYASLLDTMVHLSVSSVLVHVKQLNAKLNF